MIALILDITVNNFALLNSQFIGLPDWSVPSLIFILLAAILYLLLSNKKLRASGEKENKKIRKSEERFKKLTNLTFEGIVIHNQGILLDCNQSFLDLVGYQRRDLINENVVMKCIHPDDVHTVIENVRTQSTKPYEVRGIKKDGKIFPVEIESRDVVLENESVRVAAIRDLTERNKQNELIEKEQWLFSTLMNNIPDSIYFKDTESRFVRVNKKLLDKHNFTDAADLKGKTDFDLFGEAHAKLAYEDELSILKTGQPIIGKVEKEVWNDGRESWALTSKLPYYDPEGNLLGTFGISKNITELKNAQDKLQEEKEKFEQLLRLVPSAVFTVDTNRKITSWNSMAKELTGYDFDEVIDGACATFAKGNCDIDCGLFNENITKPIVNAICTIKKKDGSEITVSKNVDVIHDSNGKIIGGIESFIDISERIRYEEEIKNYSIELSEINKSKDRFFSIIAHDLRNPFITLLGFSEMLIEDYDEFSDEEKLSYLKEMEKSAKSSYQLLENLLQWSRSQTGSIKFSPQNINFVDILKENFTLIEKSAHMKKIKLNSNLAEEIIIRGDYDMLTTVVRNLLTNALKFTPKGGTVKVSAKELDDYIEFQISDTGIGISKDRLANIFKLEQTSSTMGTEGEKGSGLGLVLSNEFIDKHGGTIWVESEEGNGTSFFFTLPKASKPILSV